eukprot:Gregarina_sp_Poly_1__936@NODE_1226_length_4720_cov_71_108532_g834_i0_p5_GENE_NODE_1226_length_4720_cov_71_108532_g834_i0NODE_1226_length_4720_cov_71_108532_g834_i0_p5_ORF_typecomplete_len138_score16_47_NODE_1226_length_4720_cov_71_108532_g834_i027153128
MFQPGSAAFDSDLDGTTLMQTGENYDDILYENELFHEQSGISWDLLPLVLFLGVNDSDEPHFGMSLAHASRIPANQVENVAKYIIVQLDKLIYAGRKKALKKDPFPFVLVAFFHRANPIVDESFNIFQHVLSTLPKM